MKSSTPTPVTSFTSGCTKRSRSISSKESKESARNRPFAQRPERKRRYRSLLQTRSTTNRTWHFSTVWQGRCNMVQRNKEVQRVSWLDLEGKIAPEVFCAPKTGSDSHSEW